MIGQTITHYRILSRLGAGGMGEVYLAEDTQLGRQVAIKLLPAELTKSQERLRRFVQEAKAASALNHPNILTIHEIGEDGGTHFMATEFVEGETLRKRMARSPLTLREVLDIGMQVASALVAAHAAAIVHRDIKPENIMLRPDSYVKLLDFGLAKLAEKQSTAAETEAPTAAEVATDPGSVMGTARYMSPEQARGLPLDARTDIFSLGVVLYEMTTGRAPFEGTTTTDTLIAIIQRDPPPLARYSPEVPGELHRIVFKALAKDREERYQTVKNLLIDLKNLKKESDLQTELQRLGQPGLSGSTQAGPSTFPPSITATSGIAAKTGEPPSAVTSRLFIAQIKRRKLGVVLALAGLVMSVIAAIFISRVGKKESADSAAVLPGSGSGQRITQLTTWSGLDIYPSLSPDGNSIAYSSDHSGSFEIYVRQLTPGSREIQLTSDGEQNFEPAWSPDGQRVAFYSKNRGGIRLVPALGGVAKQLTDFGSRPAWSPDGSLIALQSDSLTDLGPTAFPAMPPSTLWIVPSQGGTPKQLTRPGNPRGGHGSPSYSLDGQRIAFVTSDIGTSEIWTISAQGDELKRITANDQRLFDPIWLPDGERVLYAGSSGRSACGLWSVDVLKSGGDARAKPVEVKDTGSTLYKNLTISADGKKMAFSALSMTNNLWTVPVEPGSSDAAGPPKPLTQDTSYRKTNPFFSPNGQRIAYGVSRVGSPREQWVMDADGGHPVQLLTETAGITLLGWLPKGDRFAFITVHDGKSLLRTLMIEGGREETLGKLDLEIGLGILSPDATQIAFNSNKGGAINIWTVPVEGGPARQLTFDKEMMGFACWSPDGKFLAFEVKRGDDTHVAVMPSSGGTVTQLTFDRGQSWTHSWSPNGDKIAFAGSRNGYWNIWWVSRTSKMQKQLTNYKKLNTYARYPAWSPLGNQIV